MDASKTAKAASRFVNVSLMKHSSNNVNILKLTGNIARLFGFYIMIRFIHWRIFPEIFPSSAVRQCALTPTASGPPRDGPDA
jgi:hypothetical protein